MARPPDEDNRRPPPSLEVQAVAEVRWPSGVPEQPREALHKAGIDEEEGVLAFCADVEHAIELATHLRDDAPASTNTPLSA